MLAVNDHVHGFLFVAGCDSSSFVVAVAGGRPCIAIKSVSLSAINVNWSPIRNRFLAAIFEPEYGWRFMQIVFVTGLVVDD